MAAVYPRTSTPAEHFTAGWIGASVSCAALSPLEVIKTRLQSSLSAENRVPPLKMARQIFRTEGVLGFYRGLFPHLLGVGPSRAFYFGAYNSMKTQLGKGGPNAPGYGMSGTPLHLTAATIASVASATIMSPVWVVKTRLQLQHGPIEQLSSRVQRLLGRSTAAPPDASPHPGLGGHAGVLRSGAAPAPAPAAAPTGVHVPYRGVVDAFIRVQREEGFRAFYRGLGASYLGVVETALQFAVYGSLKEHVIARREEELRAGIARGQRPDGLGPGASAGEIRRVAYTDAASFGTSAVSKLFAAVVTYPHEVLRTRLREQRDSGAGARYRGIVHATVSIYRAEGAAGLYGGMSVHLLRTVPNAAILLMVVEKMVGGEV